MKSQIQFNFKFVGKKIVNAFRCGGKFLENFIGTFLLAIHFCKSIFIVPQLVIFPQGQLELLGHPTKVETIGETSIPYQVFRDYLRGLSEGEFR